MKEVEVFTHKLQEEVSKEKSHQATIMGADSSHFSFSFLSGVPSKNCRTSKEKSHYVLVPFSIKILFCVLCRKGSLSQKFCTRGTGS